MNQEHLLSVIVLSLEASFLKDTARELILKMAVLLTIVKNE